MSRVDWHEMLRFCDLKWITMTQPYYLNLHTEMFHLICDHILVNDDESDEATLIRINNMKIAPRLKSKLKWMIMHHDKISEYVKCEDAKLL